MHAKALLERLTHAFLAPRPAPLPEPDERLALAALMVRVAVSDNDYAFCEIRRIDHLLSRIFGLGPVEAAKMRAISEKLEKQAPDTARFAHLIRETVRFEARVDALEALWEVVLADGRARETELRAIDAAREALGLSHADSARARAAAEGA